MAMWHRFCVFLIFFFLRVLVVSKPPIRRPKSFLRVSSSPISPTNTLLPEDKRLLQGTLSNGLKYYLLPSQQHLRCASYLEILTGSANEKDKECGMAHFVEHLVYTPTIAQVDSHQIKTNAFTDFHQTVFYATDCPSDSLPDLCDSLARIFDNPLQVYSDSDIDSEKLDVLSEMGQIDTPRSRVDSQIFCCLHSENILSKRLPIGQRELIQSWTRQDLLDFYHRHYHPQNANLYISGNFEAKSLAKLLQKKLSRVSPQGVTRVQEPNSLRALNRHFPPVIHRWAGRDQSKRLLNPEMKNASATVTILPSSSANEVTIHIFAKTPLLPITTVQDLRREVIRKLIQRAFQTRLHQLQSDPSNLDPLFEGEFSIHDSVKEGCTIIDLSLKCHVDHWKQSLKKLMQEASRFTEFGILENEFLDCKQSLLEASLYEEEDISSSLEKTSLMVMESVARQRTIMSSDDLKYYLEKLLLGSSLTSQEANPHILEVFSFLSTPTSSIIVAEVPQSYVDRISPKTLDTYISAQSSLQVNQTQADHLPVTIYYPTDPDFSPLTLTPSIIEWKDHQIPIERGIWNGTVSVNLASTTSLGDNRTVVRLSVPLVANISAASLIAKAIAEGGALGNFTRNQIEGWCSYHNIGVEVTHSHEKLLLTFEAPVTELHTASEKLLSLLQLICLLLESYKVERYSFARAQAKLTEQENIHQQDAGLYFRDEIFKYFSPSQEQRTGSESVSLGDANKSITTMFLHSPINISIVAPIPLENLRNLTAPFFHDLSMRHITESPPLSLPIPHPPRPLNTQIHLLGKSSHRDRNFTNGYLAGYIPQISPSTPSLSDILLLQLSQDLINQRLFDIVREKYHLVYDTSLTYHLPEGIFIISSFSPNYDACLKTIAACKDAMHSLTHDLSSLELQHHRYRIQERILEQSKKSHFWLNILHDSKIPVASWKSVNETLHNITRQQIMDFIREMEKNDNLVTFTGCTTDL